MNQYYTETLSARNLEKCYEIAPPRIVQYLNAELEFVIRSLNKSDRVLELGCGYGRVLRELLRKAHNVIGIDTSFGSLLYGQKDRSIQLIQMDAAASAFQDNSFDVVVCIQNGISAFKVDPVALVGESLRISKLGGKCIFSTYSDHIWEDRLNWFELQAEEKLLGDIDWNKTKKGTIVCKDGFVATTFSEGDFHWIAGKLGISCEIIEVDESSLFGIFTSS
ncbi:MAG: class I SAM-dependent methyltransferase [Candidatus Thorarchaeota archaeon]